MVHIMRVFCFSILNARISKMQILNTQSHSAFPARLCLQAAAGRLLLFFQMINHANSDENPLLR
jgi:hypothetical protein